MERARWIGTPLLFTLLGAGCAWTTHRSALEMAPDRWERRLRQCGVSETAIDYPLTISPEMRSAARRMAGHGGPIQQLRSLQSALFQPSRFPFDYRSRETYTAREAFEKRGGNCVSFTNLFIALARSLGHPVHAAIVDRRVRTERDEHLVVVNNHMVAVFPASTGLVVFDFDRERGEPARPLRLIDDLWIAAIYANNLGVERLRTDDPRKATVLIETATCLAPRFVEAWGNLGVALRAEGRREEALSAYRHGLQIDPGHAGVLINLAALLHETGRHREADDALAAARVRDASPYGLVVLGNLERVQNHPRKALRLFRQARRLDHRLAEPWIGIARLRLSQGRVAAARRAIGHALRFDPDHAAAIELLRELESASPL